MREWLKGRKTYLVAAGIIVSSLWTALIAADFNVGVALGALDWRTIGEAILAMTIRAGIAKS